MLNDTPDGDGFAANQGKRERSGVYAEAIFRSLHKILMSAAICAIAMALWLKFFAVPEYTAHMVVSPYSDTGASDRSVTGAGVLALLGGGASALGGSGSFGLYLESRNSMPIAARLEQDPDVKAHFFSGQWDPVRQAWHPPSGFVAAIASALKSVLGYPTWSPPDASDVVQILDWRIKTSQDMQKGSYTFTFSDRDPIFAASLLQRVHEYTEQRLRDQALQRTTLQIQHLISELSQNTIAENRQVLTQILMQQQQQRSRINPAIPFSALAVDPASTARKRTYPQPLLFELLALIVPAMIGLLLVVWPIANPQLFAALRGYSRKLRPNFMRGVKLWPPFARSSARGRIHAK